MSTELKVLERKANPLIERATAITIQDTKTLTEATAVLSQMNTYLDSVITAREKITKPANEALKNARALFDPIEKPIKNAVAALRSQIGEYQTEQARIAQEKKDKIATKLTEGKLSLNTAIKKLDKIDEPEEEVNTDSGTLKFRSKQVLEITDESLIPREYLVVDESAVLNALKSGVAVAGARIKTIQTPVNYR